AEVLATRFRSRVLFEPFNPERVRRIRRLHRFEYHRREEPCKELHEYCASLFSGGIRNAWIDREVKTLRPASRLVKTIRANLMLDWIDRNFPAVPKILIVRHPCAVAVSRMRLGWDTDEDIQPFLDQPRLVDDFLAEHLPRVRSASHIEEKHALIWSIHQMVPLAQLGPDRLHVVFYEDLVSDPDSTWERVFRWLGQPFDTSTLRMARRPSTTSTARSAIVRGIDPLTQWQRDLSADQISRILQVVRGFSLDYLYGEAATPLPAARDRLRQHAHETSGEDTAGQAPQPLFHATRYSTSPEYHR
ncbi:MAG: sulfotransferase, partial [Acidobacteriota bacterium]